MSNIQTPNANTPTGEERGCLEHATLGGQGELAVCMGGHFCVNAQNKYMREETPKRQEKGGNSKMKIWKKETQRQGHEKYGVKKCGRGEDEQETKRKSKDMKERQDQYPQHDFKLQWVNGRLVSKFKADPIRLSRQTWVRFLLGA
ncbi:hypothetical protein K438DRAFT_1752548 [Mycena galopus ATCC 62051]|nr:hypothetical protein K438DRAFT_1752548 [Mycena galopus ATCC 62051]